MEFAYAGPFASLLDSRVGRSFAPQYDRDRAGNLIAPRRYSCSAQNYTIERSIPWQIVDALVSKFGRELNSVLEEVTA